MDNNTVILDFLINAYTNEIPLSNVLNADIIRAFCGNADPEIRSWTAKAFVLDKPTDFIIACLLELANDYEESVRVEAVDSLSNFCTNSSFNCLCAAIEDESPLVRAYAAFGVAYVGRELCPDEAKRILIREEANEQCERVLVGVYEGLYILGEKDRIHMLLSMLNSGDFYTCCAATHALQEIVNAENNNIILSALEGFNFSACPLAVVDAINKLIMLCDTQADAGTGSDLYAT